MVKFNPKQVKKNKPVRTVNTSAPVPISERIRLNFNELVCTSLKNKLFDKHEAYFSDIEIHSNMHFIPEYKDMSADEVADKIALTITEGEYILFIDDDRTPEPDPYTVQICARTNAAAIAVVDKYGIPGTIHFDYWLNMTGSELVTTFIKHLKEVVIKKNYTGFINYAIQSQHENGPRIIHKAMREIEDVIFQNSKGNSD